VNAGSSVTLASGSGLAKSGYAFNGWSADASGAGASYNAGSSYTPASSVTLYAKWTAVQYTVTYNANGGTGTAPSSQTVNAGSSVTLASGSGLTKSGYAFSGWSADASGAGSPYNAGSSYTPASSVTLYAKWTVVAYTITYHLNGGPNNGANPMSYTIESSGITLAAPTLTNYSFGGWYDNAELTGGAVAGIPAGSTGDREFYAKWTPLVSIQISLRPAPDDPQLSNASLFVNEPAQFSAGSGYSSYAWYWDGEAISGASSPTYTLAADSRTPGVYELSVFVTTSAGETLSARCRVIIKGN
jgi:uncharacterized repeat protein (TIGR02543 family)